MDLADTEEEEIIFSAATEFLELGLEVFTGRLERGGGGGILKRVRWLGGTWAGKYTVSQPGSVLMLSGSRSPAD